MLCSLEELRSKEVIDLGTGERLGYIDDIRFDTDTSEVAALVIYGGSRLFGLLPNGDDLEIPCAAIEVVGTETILVRCTDLTYHTNIRRNRLKSLFD